MPIACPVRDRFWTKVDIGDSSTCWEWRAARYPGGYGCIRVDGHGRQAHRVAWELEHGSIPDNPPCCNPAHLFLGTRAENMQDMKGKGRQAVNVGAANEHHWACRLTDDEVREMRRLFATGCHTRSALGALFGVSRKHAGDIVRHATRRL